MDTVNNLEKTFAAWYKKAPHLPKDGQSWLAHNVWWIVLVGVIVSVFSLLALIPLTLVAIGLTTAAQVAVAPYPGYDFSTAYTGIFWLSTLVSLLGLLVTTVLLAVAIGPLKSVARKGWTLLFVVAVINVALSVLASLITLNVIGAIFALAWAAVWGYFLFEIRSYFGAKHKVEHKTAAKA